MRFMYLLIGLISSKKQWRAAKKLVSVLKGLIKIKFSLYKILAKIPSKKER